MKYRINYFSDIGPVREENQDNFFIDGIAVNEFSVDYVKGFLEIEATENQPVLVSVFDGMGGEACGKDISLCAAKSFHKLKKQLSASNLTEKKIANIVGRHYPKVLREVKKILRKNWATIGGTTCVSLLIIGDKAWIIWAGDSRAYHLKQNDEFQRLTMDQTLGQAYVNDGYYTEEQARETPYWHMLQNFIGYDEGYFLMFPISLNNKDVVFLCSDGVSDMYKDDELHGILSNENAEEVMQKLLDDMYEKGNDNGTVVMLKKVDEADSEEALDSEVVPEETNAEI